MGGAGGGPILLALTSYPANNNFAEYHSTLMRKTAKNDSDIKIVTQCSLLS